MIRTLLSLALSFVLWAAVATVINLGLHLIGLTVSFWCVYSLVLIGTIVYFYLTNPMACPIKLKK
jgi:hypothetical protein